MLYLSIEELREHGLKYSQTYKKGYGLWADSFDAMAMKTVIKLLLSKYAPMSIDMQIATNADQSIIKAIDNGIIEVDYIDNIELTAQEIDEDKEKDRCAEYINNCNDYKKLITVQSSAYSLGLIDLYENKIHSLTKK